MLSLRCSSLPLFMSCSAWTQPGLDVSLQDDGAARLGTAIHAALLCWISTGQPDEEILPRLAAENNVELEELRRETWFAWRAWESMNIHFPRPQHEWPLSFQDIEAGLELTGHLDLASILTDGDYLEPRLLDLKTGRLDSDHTHQLKGYAFLLSQRYPQAKRIYTVVLRSRDGSAEGTYYSRTELFAWYVSVLNRARERHLYRPGAHCGFCPRRTGCEAQTQLMQQAVRTLLAVEEANNGDFTLQGENRGEKYRHLLERCKQVEGLCKAVREQITAETEAAGGSLAAGPGHELQLVSQVRQKIQFPQAFNLLNQVLGDGMVPLMEVSKTKLEAAIRERAPRGQKAKAVASLLQQLDEAGAIRHDETRMLQIKRVPNLITQQQETVS